MDSNHQRIEISGEGDLPRAVNAARAVAEQAGFATTQQFMIATAASELATNIVRYATCGEVSIAAMNDRARKGIQIVATDDGPGIEDIGLAMQDHFSTGDGLGLGLPGVGRLMDELSIDSRPGAGTTVTATKWLHPSRRELEPSVAIQPLRSGVECGDTTAERHIELEPSVAIRPLLSDVECGDTAVVKRIDDRLFLGMVDVLGHGREAYEVAEACKRFLEDHCDEPLVKLLQDLHQHIKSSRGAVAGLSVLETESDTLKFVGIGNITARTLGAKPGRLISRSGVVGYMMPTPREESLTLSDGDILLIYSDGVKSHFEIEDWPQMRTSSAATLAHDIINLFGKDTDDAACIALRYET